MPTHGKKNAVGKSGPDATFNVNFIGFGWPFGWGVRRFS